MKKQITLLHLLYFAVIILLVLLFLKHVFVNENTNPTSEDFTITGRKTVVPTDEEMQILKEIYQKVCTYSADIEASKSEIIQLHNNVKNALVCSDANRYFNSLKNSYDTYQQKILAVQEPISLYEETYDSFLDAISKIPQYSSSYEKKYLEFIEKFGADYEMIRETKQKYLEYDENLNTLYLEAKKIADDLFEEYFDLMCHIVNAEAGIYNTLERCFVANVIENRIKHPIFPNTLYEVIYSPGQYAPVMNGSINKTPPNSVKQDMEEYLRGRIDTGMPDYVVYQARFPQGTGTWRLMPSGHYFCY